MITTCYYIISELWTANEGNVQEVEIDGSMHAFESEGCDDMNMYASSASESTRPVSENDSDSGEEYSDASSNEQDEEPMSSELNMESIPESSFEALYTGYSLWSFILHNEVWQ